MIRKIFVPKNDELSEKLKLLHNREIWFMQVT